MAIRPWRTIGTLSVIPGREDCRFVECQSCQSTFDVVVLAGPHTHLEDALTAALRRASAAILGSEHPLDPGTRRAAVIVLQRHASVPYRSDDLDNDLDAETSDPGRALEELYDLAPRLNERSRMTFVEAIVQLVAENRRIRPGRMESLESVAEVLGIDTDTVRNALRRQHIQARLAV